MTSPTPSSRSPVLVVTDRDDDEGLDSTLVTRCRSVAEAGALLADGVDATCVVLDLVLPRTETADAIDTLRALRPGVPVVAVDREAHARDLREARQELHDFAHRMAHDLNSPMSVVIGAIDLLERAAPGADTSEILAMLARSSTRLVKTVDRLREYADASTSDGEPVIVDLDRVLDWVIETLDTELDGVDFRASRPLPSVLGTEVGLRHVFLNLFENAVTYAEPGRPLRVDVSTEDHGPDRVVVMVSDNGRGIPSEHRSAVFRPGYRIDRSTDGSGLGLATVLRTIEGFDGQVTLEVGPDGVGSRFRLELALPGTVR